MRSTAGRAARFVGSAGLALALAGCWLVPGATPERTGHNAFETRLTPETVGDLAPLWTHATGGLAVLDPVVGTGGVHAMVEGCGLVTLAATGEVRWESGTTFPSFCPTVDQRWIWTPAFAADQDVVFAGVAWALDSTPSDRFGAFTRALHVRTGAPTGPELSGIVVGQRGEDLVLAQPAFVGFTGPPVQIQDWGPPISVTLGPADAPVRRTIRLAVTPPAGALESVTPTLGPAALFHAGTGVMTTVPGDPTPGRAVRAWAVDGPATQCPVTTSGATVQVDCPTWVAPLDAAPVGAPVLDAATATVYVATAGGTLHALDAATGAVRWTGALGAAAGAAPAIDGSSVFVPTVDGRLVALAATGCGTATCDPVWTADTGHAIGVQPAVAGGVVYTGSADGSVHAFDARGCGAATCPDLWSADAGGEVTGAPAVTGGRLYVGTRGGLVAYG